MGREHYLIIQPDPKPKTLEEKQRMATVYERTTRQILDEATKGDPYWLKPQELEDGEIGLPRIGIIGSLIKQQSKLREGNNQTET